MSNTALRQTRERLDRGDLRTAIAKLVRIRQLSLGNWVRIEWTVVMAVTGIVLDRWLEASQGACPPNDLYCAVGEGADNAVAGLLVGGLFVIWLAGFGLISLVAWLSQRRADSDLIRKQRDRFIS